MAYDNQEETSQDIPSFQGMIGGGSLKGYRHRTKLERLNDTKKGLEAKLAEVNNAIKLLEDNPNLTEVIDALEKVGV